MEVRRRQRGIMNYCLCISHLAEPSVKKTAKENAVGKKY